MIARKSALVVLNNVLGAVLGFVAIKVTSLYLGPEIIGEFDAALGFLGLLFFMTDLGFGNAHTKRVSEGMDAGDCLATFAVFKTVTTTAFVATAFGVLAFRLFVLEKPIVDATPAALVVATAYMVVKSLSMVPNATFDAKRETARSQLALLAETTVRVVLVIPVSLLVAAAVRAAGPFADTAIAASPAAAWAAAHPAAAYGLTWAVSAVAGAVVAFVYVPRSSWGRFRWDILRSYWAYALPIFLVSAVHTISTYIDKATLAYFWTDFEVGQFSQPRRITAFLEILPMALMLLLFPTVSALHAQRRFEEIEETAYRAERYSSMVVLPVVVVLLVYAEAVILVALSAAWLPAVWTLRFLAVYALLIALTRPSLAVLLGSDRPGAAARIGAAMTASNIVLTLFLVPPPLRIVPIRLPGLADEGAALATMLSGLVGFLLFRRAAKTHGLRRSSAYLLVHLVAAVVMALAMAALPVLFGVATMRWWHLGLFSGAGGLVYLGVLVALGGFTRDDARFFRDALHVGNLGRYVREELRR